MKYLKALYGLWLYWRFNKKINYSKLVKNKRVAIIGAANSALNTNLGDYIDEFDFVIRINKAPRLIYEGTHASDIGRKTDILFHSFYENEKSGGGPLDFNLFDKLGIKYVINPVATFSGSRVTYNFYKKYLLPKVTYSVQRDDYNKVVQGLNGNKPTIGFCALMLTLLSDCKEVYVTGFTFFKTPFAKGYRDEVQQPEQVRKLINTEGHHDVDLEFENFKQIYREYPQLKLDLALQDILRNG
ncbi:glycosyltransferase family 29 protein [Fulvivirga sp. 29W222]|uniref:Glycosyltransferase family 29 protein n=1 Tax=Fulvivirga marina TaxID=2494733 RepID=A0A937FTS8_9BACT|nr:glycosyltransferase family 29 protein [Fulvivirga marina]MBL6444763.1 glycosyltransferase family 29 protein [Fulvivirga marina]